MLAVTAVEGCRYCSYFHAKQALKSEVTPEEISRLLSGDVDNCPEEEAMAVIYAQHWAESGCGLPDYCGGADLDKKNAVDLNDLAIIEETWLDCSMPYCY